MQYGLPQVAHAAALRLSAGGARHSPRSRVVSSLAERREHSQTLLHGAAAAPPKPRTGALTRAASSKQNAQVAAGSAATHVRASWHS